MARPKKEQQFNTKVIKLAKSFVQKHNIIARGGRWNGFAPEVADDLLGDDLKSWRTGQSAKQTDVAKRMRVSPCVISNLEAGRLHWDAEKVLRYVDAVVALVS